MKFINEYNDFEKDKDFLYIKSVLELKDKLFNIIKSKLQEFDNYKINDPELVERGSLYSLLSRFDGILDEYKSDYFHQDYIDIFYESLLLFSITLKIEYKEEDKYISLNNNNSKEDFKKWISSEMNCLKSIEKLYNMFENTFDIHICDNVGEYEFNLLYDLKRHNENNIKLLKNINK
jgi:hypothetical protein